MTDKFGPWEPLTVEQMAQLFDAGPFRWWLAGGVALELFACRSWRQHEDIDVGVCRDDAPLVYEWLRDFELFVAAGGRLRRWSGEPLSAEHNENNVWVRPVDLATDIPELTELLHRAYRELADLGFRYVASFQDEATTRRRAGRGTCFVALLGSRIVGTITLYDIAEMAGCAWYDRDDVSHFGQFAVDPTVRSVGLGSALMDLVERRAAEMGARELALNTAEGADHLIRYYQRRGYRKVGRVDWGINYNSVILSKTLRQNKS